MAADAELEAKIVPDDSELDNVEDELEADVNAEDGAAGGNGAGGGPGGLLAISGKLGGLIGILGIIVSLLEPILEFIKLISRALQLALVPFLALLTPLMERILVFLTRKLPEFVDLMHGVTRKIGNIFEVLTSKIESVLDTFSKGNAKDTVVSGGKELGGMAGASLFNAATMGMGPGLVQFGQSVNNDLGNPVGDLAGILRDLWNDRSDEAWKDNAASGGASTGDSSTYGGGSSSGGG